MNTLAAALLALAGLGGVAVGAQAADQRCAISDRVDCSGRLTPAGFALNISQAECESRGCCYDATADRLKCYYAAEGVPVTHVHVVNSNHFDAGYADLTSIVINEYFDHYFPLSRRPSAPTSARRCSGSRSRGSSRSTSTARPASASLVRA